MLLRLMPVAAAIITARYFAKIRFSLLFMRLLDDAAGYASAMLLLFSLLLLLTLLLDSAAYHMLIHFHIL